MDISRHVEYRWGGNLIKSRTVDIFPDHQPNVDVGRCWNISTISRHQEFKMWLFPASIAGSFLPVTEVLMGSHRTHHPCAWRKPRATGTNVSNLGFVQKAFHLFTEDKEEALNIEYESVWRLRSPECYWVNQFLFLHAVLMPHPPQAEHSRQTFEGIK